MCSELDEKLGLARCLFKRLGSESEKLQVVASVATAVFAGTSLVSEERTVLR